MKKFQSARCVQDVVSLAQFAEIAGRYEDMVKFMIEVTILNKGILSLEERNLLSNAFKQVIVERRRSWRQLAIIER